MSRYTQRSCLSAPQRQHSEQPKVRDYSGLRVRIAPQFTFLITLMSIRDKPWS